MQYSRKLVQTQMYFRRFLCPLEKQQPEIRLDLRS